MDWLTDNPDRFHLEVSLLKQVYPEVNLVKQHGRLRARMKIKWRRTVYSGELVFPRDYPFGEIQAYVLDPRIRNSPHRYSSKELCLSHDNVTPETLAIHVADWLVEWIAAFEQWKRTGTWPDRVRKSNRRRGRP